MIGRATNEPMLAVSSIDELHAIKDMVDLLHMATVGMMEKDDSRVFGVATMQVLRMVESLIAKIEGGR